MGELSTSIIWLALMIILIIIEIVTVGLTTIWFAAGALVSTIVASIGGPIGIQIIVFFVVSILLLIFTRPLAVKYINNTRVKTNYEGVIGKIVRTTEAVNNYESTGCAIVNGQEWTVRSVDDEKTIPKGSLCKVLSISGVKLIVEEYKEEI